MQYYVVQPLFASLNWLCTIYMVVQPTKSRKGPELPNVAMVVGVPPLIAPISREPIGPFVTLKLYVLPSRETFDQGNCEELLSELV